MLRGKARDMGLGSATIYSLADVRAKAAEYRKMLKEGLDPISARNDAQQAAALTAARAITFQDCADRYIEAHSVKWKNAKHIYQWKATIKDKAGPVIGNVPVQDVTTDLVVKALKPILVGHARDGFPAAWADRSHHRLGGPCTNTARKAPTPPAGGDTSIIYCRPFRVRSVSFTSRRCPMPKCRPSMPNWLPAGQPAAAALELTILTACRTGEVVGARRAEVDRAKRVWIIPANRMKAGVEHRVPLTDRMIELVRPDGRGRREKPFFLPQPRRQTDVEYGDA